MQERLPDQILNIPVRLLCTKVSSRIPQTFVLNTEHVISAVSAETKEVGVCLCAQSLQLCRSRSRRLQTGAEIREEFVTQPDGLQQ